MGAEKLKKEIEQNDAVTKKAQRLSAASGVELNAQVAAEVADTASKLDDGASP